MPPQTGQLKGEKTLRVTKYNFKAVQDYSEENTTLAIKIQFFAIEIARNRAGLNDCLRGKFKPTQRKPRGQATGTALHCTVSTVLYPHCPGGTTRGGVNMQEIEHELQQVLGGQHPLLQS